MKKKSDKKTPHNLKWQIRDIKQAVSYYGRKNGRNQSMSSAVFHFREFVKVHGIDKSHWKTIWMLYCVEGDAKKHMEHIPDDWDFNKVIRYLHNLYPSPSELEKLIKIAINYRYITYNNMTITFQSGKHMLNDTTLRSHSRRQ